MTDNAQKPVLIVCGPTASGKSALALDIARKFDGVIINADSMQVYRELRILTARPSLCDEARAPHRLYGIASVTDPFSAGRWRELAGAEIDAAHRADKLPIVCGGTGLYLKALTEGLSEMPDIPQDVRDAVRRRVRDLGAPACHHALSLQDPRTAARLAPGDAQRIARALEVWEATGRPLADWQAEKRSGPRPEWRFSTFLLAPSRATLHRAIDARFRSMIDAGALAEVRALDGLDETLPALKAVGVPDLRRLLAGELEESEAIERAQRATRQFAKRQGTWFRNQIIADMALNAQYMESFSEDFFSFIRTNVLTLTD